MEKIFLAFEFCAEKKGNFLCPVKYCDQKFTMLGKLYNHCKYAHNIDVKEALATPKLNAVFKGEAPPLPEKDFPVHSMEEYIPDYKRSQ